MNQAVLLINLGTPARADYSAVSIYLAEFLTDKRVIDIPAIIRYLLVLGVIVPFRTKKSTQAYKSIWRNEGSPLLCNSQALQSALQEQLGGNYRVALGMSYGQPSISKGLEKLEDCHSLTIVPLYPQYSSAASGSAIEKALKQIQQLEVIPHLKVIKEFYHYPEYIKAQAELIRTSADPADFLLFSYHGVPERQIHKSGCPTICATPCVKANSAHCYRAQCYKTSQLIAKALNISEHQYCTSFQSRLGKTAWIKPYTEEQFQLLINQGIKNITLVSPSFVTDCLETLEELGIRGRQQWQSLGGQNLTLVPAMNNHPLWVNALASIVKKTNPF